MLEKTQFKVGWASAHREIYVLNSGGLKPTLQVIKNKPGVYKKLYTFKELQGFIINIETRDIREK